MIQYYLTIWISTHLILIHYGAAKYVPRDRILDFLGLEHNMAIPIEDRLAYVKLKEYQREYFFRQDNNQHEKIKNKIKRELPDTTDYLKAKPVIDNLNERQIIEHREKINKRIWRDPWDKKGERKALAYYTSNESKMKPYVYNERAYLEKKNKKWLDYQDYEWRMKNDPNFLKPKVNHYTDPAIYINMPRAKKNRKERAKRDAPTKRTTWAVYHWRPFTGSLKFNFSGEIHEQMIENYKVQELRQKALQETGVYKYAEHLGNRTTYRLPTYRNFMEELRTSRKPYTFPSPAPIPEIDNLESGYHIDSRRITLPHNYKDWIQQQLFSYRRGYLKATDLYPFAHYPEYSWENIGFDMAKIEDPFPPIMPLEKMRFNVEALRQHMDPGCPDLEGAPFDPNQWDSKGKEITTLFPKTEPRRIIIPNI